MKLRAILEVKNLEHTALCCGARAVVPHYCIDIKRILNDLSTSVDTSRFKLHATG